MRDLSNPGFKAAWCAMLMDNLDPINPGAEDSPMHVLDRVIVAYDRFKFMPSAESFSPNDVEEYVLAYERREQPVT